MSSSSPNLILDTFKDRSPVLFDGANRIPAVEDVRNVLIYVCFATLFIAFLIIFPGIRKEVSKEEEVVEVHASSKLESEKTRVSLNIDIIWQNTLQQLFEYTEFLLFTSQSHSMSAVVHSLTSLFFLSSPLSFSAFRRSSA